MNRLIIPALSIMVVALVLLSCAQPQSDSEEWRVEIVPPGNEFYQPHEPESAQDPEPEGPPPSERLLDIVRTLAPSHTDIGDWLLRGDGTYRIRAEAGSERYDYHLTADGGIIEIEYNDDSTRVREKAYSLILKGTKEIVALDDVPSRALEILARVIPDTVATKAWIASTIVGPRYVIIVGGSAYYARPDGQIQSARRIDEGALEENYPKDGDRDEIIEGIMAEARESLGEYCERFNYEKQIERLGRGESDPDAPFRFVVMGDTRSNMALWSFILDHVSSLDNPPEFILNTGDLVSRGFVEEFRDYFVPPLLDTEYFHFSAVGNHDHGYEKLAVEYRFLFGENSLNYYFDYGTYRFIFFDNVSKLIPMEETIAWLGDLLAETPDDRHVVVIAHRPFNNIEKWAWHFPMGMEDSKAVTALMTEHEVSHVFLGHIHAYSTTTFEGVDYTVTGGGGAGLYRLYGPDGNFHHYIIVDAQPDGVLKQQVVRFRENSDR